VQWFTSFELDEAMTCWTNYDRPRSVSTATFIFAEVQRGQRLLQVQLIILHFTLFPPTVYGEIGRCQLPNLSSVGCSSTPDSAQANMILSKNPQICSPKLSPLSCFADFVVFDLAVAVAVDALLINIQFVSLPSLPLQRSLVAWTQYGHK